MLTEENNHHVHQYSHPPIELSREEPEEGKGLYSTTLFPPGPDPLRIEEREWVRKKYADEGTLPLSDSGYVLWLEEKVNYLYGYIVDSMASTQSSKSQKEGIGNG